MRIVNVCVPSINVSEILMFVILFILLLNSITNFIVPNKPQHINIACLSLRSVKILIIHGHFIFLCLFVCVFVVVVVVVFFCFVCSFNGIKKYLA